MTSENKKKRKYFEEKRNFNDDWEDNYAFIQQDDKALCLICKTTLKNFKVGNLRRHYEKSHSDFSDHFPEKSELRSKKIKSLKSSLNSQVNFMTKFTRESKSLSLASFMMSWNIARDKRPYTEGDFIKKNMLDIIKTLDPNNTKLLNSIENIPASRHTVERRISAINSDLLQQLHNDVNNCVAFSLALDESTDITDQPQLAIFIRFVSNDCVSREELLDMIALKDTTRGVDIKNALDDALKVVPKNKLVSVATDGAAAMVGKNIGLIGLLKKDETIPDFIYIHCIIHREHLIAKHFNFEHVFAPVLKIVNYIRTNAKNHRQFRNFIEDCNLTEPITDMSLYCIVRWLSTYDVLYKFVALLEPISEFLETKKQSYPQLKDSDWILDLMFLCDIMEHLKLLNVALQGKNKNISELTQNIFSFKNKLKLFERDITDKNFNHFPRLKAHAATFNVSSNAIENYKQKLKSMFDNFEERFADLEELKPSIAFLLNPFQHDVVNNGLTTIPQQILSETAKGEMELIELQEDVGLQMVYKSEKSINEFWNLVPIQKYGILKNAACRLLSLFGSTYEVESLYSNMKFIKSKFRSQLTNSHLNELLRSAVTNYTPDYPKLVSNLQIHSGSSQ